MARRLIPPLINRVVTKETFISSSKTNASHFISNNSIQVGWITQFLNNYSTKYSKDRVRNSDNSMRQRQSRKSDQYTTLRKNTLPAEVHTSSNNVMRQSRNSDQYTNLRENTLPEVQYDSEPMQDVNRFSEENIGMNISKKEKHKFLLDTLLGLEESKEAVYGTLDAWVAWERKFPIASLRIALGRLEKQQEWHRVIQVLKWILSKGQGNTMGVYRQLINALDKDNRPEEAHNFWMKKIGSDLHSVPWDLCTLMISIYYRNNMPERLVKLFKGLQSYDRKPPDKSVVQKVADAYEMLGLLEEKNRVLEKYNDIFTDKWRGNPKKSKKAAHAESHSVLTKKTSKKAENTVGRNQTETYNEESNSKGVPMSSSIQSCTMDDARVTPPCTQQNKKIDLIETVHRMIRS